MPTINPQWRARHGGQLFSEHHADLQRKERISLEYHASKEGCRLIVCPEVPYKSAAARISRLRRLLEFLQNMSDDKVEIARGPLLPQGENFLMVGDWFSASSISGHLARGYRQTIFTRHAPTLRKQLLRYEEEFEEAKRAQPWPSAPSSRLGAIQQSVNRRDDSGLPNDALQATKLTNSSRVSGALRVDFADQQCVPL